VLRLCVPPCVSHGGPPCRRGQQTAAAPYAPPPPLLRAAAGRQVPATWYSNRVLTSALCPPPADGQYRIAGQGTYAFCAQSCDACAGCTGFGISNNGCWLKKTTGLRALSNSVCYYNPGAFTTTPSSPPPSTAVVVYTSAGPNLDCSGTDLQTCYGCTRPLLLCRRLRAC